MQRLSSSLSKIASRTLSTSLRSMSTIPGHQWPGRDTQDKLLFTPGPLTTSWTVKNAATVDMGSRDVAFIKVIQEVRSGLLGVAGVKNPADWTTCIVQGSGTFGVEATITSVIPRGGKLLLLANGAYGLRIKSMCDMHNIDCTVIECSDDEYPSAHFTESTLRNDPSITHVAMVHSETTSGIVNNVQEIGTICSQFGKTFIVDAMSSFGGIPLDLDACHVDYIVSSSNKCIEGIPGFSFAICRKAPLEAARGSARVLSLDIHRQLEGLEQNGQFRFTPPTHSLLAFHQALKELELEGGVKARHERYRGNQVVLQKGMAALGFEPYMPKEKQGCIITSYRYPVDAGWDFTKFYTLLSDRGFVIYPGKVSKADCFRIGHIGRLFPQDSEALLVAMDEVCKEMKTAKYAQTAAQNASM